MLFDYDIHCNEKRNNVQRGKQIEIEIRHVFLYCGHTSFYSINKTHWHSSSHNTYPTFHKPVNNLQTLQSIENRRKLKTMDLCIISNHIGKVYTPTRFTPNDT